MFRNDEGGINYSGMAKVGGAGYLGWRNWSGLKNGAAGMMAMGRTMGNAESFRSAAYTFSGGLRDGAMAIGNSAKGLYRDLGSDFHGAPTIGRGLRSAARRLFVGKLRG